MRKMIFLEVREELTNNLFEYININKLAKKLKRTRQAVKLYVEVLRDCGLWNKPFCEWHDEMLDETAELIRIKKKLGIERKNGTRL